MLRDQIGVDGPERMLAVYKWLRALVEGFIG
jgi:hypothetical protein